MFERLKIKIRLEGLQSGLMFLKDKGEVDLSSSKVFLLLILNFSFLQSYDPNPYFCAHVKEDEK